MDYTAKEVAEILGVSKTFVNNLVRRGKLKAQLQNVPVPYYLIDGVSVEAYKNAPKDKGGRPRRKKNE